MKQNNSLTSFIIADLQDITQLGIISLIKSECDNYAITVVSSKKQLIKSLIQYPESIIIIDYTLFDIPSAEDLEILISRFPAALWFIFYNDLSTSFIQRISGLLTVGFICKSDSVNEITSALKAATNHSIYICSHAANTIHSHVTSPSGSSLISTLTPAETEILKLIAHGHSAKEIAEYRYSSIHTIITHKKNIFRKLEVNT
ncbi:MAG: response regulator transcription factor, partial [Muribaculaceae bacterium]|nr:response regulator transcription factor [Muribaculaceae bacterium]